MSVEEEIELRDLVAQTLETNGCMAKIRAQLRASIFLALDEDVKVSKQEPLMNNKLKTFLDTPDGQAMFSVVREFLDFFNLQFTISVYEAEAYLTNSKIEERHKIVQDLGLNNVLDESTKVPLLLQLIKIAQTKTKSLEINLNVNSNGIDEHKESISQDDDTSSNIKTDTNSIVTNKSSNEIIAQKVTVDSPVKLNQTFQIIHPQTDFLDNTQEPSESNNGIKDDTYEDTSSIAEDSVASTNLLMPIEETKFFTALDSTPNESKSILENSSTDKLKKPADKIKPKTNLSSLSDLPPLQMNKSRLNNDILPSLYTKEFKDKSNLRELDKVFDINQEYEEEDFMCSGDLSLKSNNSKGSLLEELQTSMGKVRQDAKMKSSIISDCSKGLVNNLKSNGETEPVKNSDHSNTSSGISENLENDLNSAN